VHFVLNDQENRSLMQKIAEDEKLDHSFGEEQLFKIQSDFIFFANPFERTKELHATTIFLEHGIGTKSTAFYPVLEYIDIYLVEGSYKYERLASLYPHLTHKLHKVGFSKFDPIANMPPDLKSSLSKAYNLDPTKKTILYAPTFFPSSIEKMDADFPRHFHNYNILIKAHYLTYERKQYKNQRKQLTHWNSFENCTVLDVDTYDLVPLFALSDLMISDESSAMFEFAALNKPVVSNRYFKLRLSYYLRPSKLYKRIDKGKEKYREILYNANNYNETLRLAKEALRQTPDRLAAKRVAFSKDICGTIDGKVSARIVDLLEGYHG